eukprot:Rhum_TRINITY_DN15249_c5_g2::Rhum_TRINITY_DN15249_c5_g2_i1::g.146100::m.146100
MGGGVSTATAAVLTATSPSPVHRTDAPLQSNWWRSAGCWRRSLRGAAEAETAEDGSGGGGVVGASGGSVRGGGRGSLSALLQEMKIVQHHVLIKRLAENEKVAERFAAADRLEAEHASLREALERERHGPPRAAGGAVLRRGAHHQRHATAGRSAR